MTAWHKSYLDWLVDSPFGRTESAATNNHATYAAMQIAADGSQPCELARTRSWHYSNYNLAAFGRLAAIGDHIGEDLWHYQGPLRGKRHHPRRGRSR